MDPSDFCEHCGCWLDHPQVTHATRCPRYDGPDPAEEGDERARLLVAYLAAVRAACASESRGQAREAYDLAVTVAERLDMPEHVRPVLGEHEADVTLKFARWLAE